MINEDDYNLSLLLLFPLIANDNETYKTYIGGNEVALFNGYSLDKNKPWLDNHFFLLIDVEKLRIVKEKELKDNKNFIARYYYVIKDSGYFYSYVFSCPENHEKDFNFIKESQFSKISNNAKLKILEFWELGRTSNLFKTLFEDLSKDIVISKQEIPEETKPSIMFGEVY